MRFFVGTLVLACALTGAASAHAGSDQARQVLPPGDGWASSGPGTTGGSAAPAGHVHEVRTRAELVAALASPAPRIIKVKGVLDANTDADGKPLRCKDYATDGYTLPGYLTAYDPAVWGWEREPEGPMENARVASAKRQEAAIALNVGSDTTIIGVGRGAGITGGSLRIHGVRNVIVRNLTFRDTHDCFPQWDPDDNSPGAPPGNWNSLYDSVSVQKSEHVWVDHTTFTDEPNVDSTQPLHFGRPYQVHDGQLDITSGADLVTVSRNVFTEHGKTMLIGSSNSSTTDPGKLRVSVHHNVFRNVQERAPRVRFGQVHVYDNLYEGAQVYSWGVGVRSQIHAQNNFIRGIAPEKIVYNWGGTAITDTGNLVDGRPVSLVEAYNAVNPAKQLGTDAGWTPTLNRGLEPAHRIRHLQAGAQPAGHHLVVGQGFATVQSAIDDASAGGVITLPKGVYREVIKIPASKRGLTLRGATGRAQDVVIDYDNANGTKKPDGTTYGTSGSSVAMMHHNLGSTGDVMKALGPEKVSAMPLPKGPSGKRTVVPNPTDGFAVFKGGRNQDAAWKFVEFLTSAESNGHLTRAEWITAGACDILRAGPAGSGGITPVLKAVHLAESFNMDCEIHGNGSGSLTVLGATDAGRWYERGLLHPHVDFDRVPPHRNGIADP